LKKTQVEKLRKNGRIFREGEGVGKFPMEKGKKRGRSIFK